MADKGVFSGRKRGRAADGAQHKPSSRLPNDGDGFDDEAALEAAVFGIKSGATYSSDMKSETFGEREAPRAAWADDDELEVNVNIAKTSRLRKLRTREAEEKVDGTTYAARLRQQKMIAASVPGKKHWADTPAHDDSDSEDSESEATLSIPTATVLSDAALSRKASEYENALLRSTAPTTTSASMALPFGKLAIKRLRDANRDGNPGAVLQSAVFHPNNGNVLLTAGLDKRLRFFHVDGKANTCVTNVFFEDMPISHAEWMRNGDEVLVCGRRPFFYTYDITAGAATRVPRITSRDDKSWESAVAQRVADSDSAIEPLICFYGNDGTAVLVSQRTKSWVSNLKMSGALRAAAFIKSVSGTGFDDLITAGTEGEVYRWDLRTMKCMARHVDEGSTGVTCLAAARDGSRYAVGSTMGIVNVYDAAADITPAAGASNSIRSLFASSCAPKPLHTISTLTTSISMLEYSSDGALLAMGSQRLKDSFRLVHTASGKTFGNWPTSKTPLGYVTCSSFSPHTGYLTVGNDKGRALLYRLNHYSEA